MDIFAGSSPPGGGGCTHQLVSEKLESDGTITILERADLALERHSFNLIDMLVGNYIPPISQLIRRTSADLVGRLGWAAEHPG